MMEWTRCGDGFFRRNVTMESPRFLRRRKPVSQLHYTQNMFIDPAILTIQTGPAGRGAWPWRQPAYLTA
jgi:hypothetical protein